MPQICNMVDNTKHLLENDEVHVNFVHNFVSKQDGAWLSCSTLIAKPI